MNTLLLDGLPLVCWTILHGYQDMLDLLWLDEVIVHSRLHSQLYNELDGVYSTKWDGQVIKPNLVQSYLTKGGSRVLSDLYLNLLFLALYIKYKE